MNARAPTIRTNWKGRETPGGVATKI